MAAILRASRAVCSTGLQGLTRRAYATKPTPPRIEPDEVKFPKFSELSKTTKIILTGGFIIAAGGEAVLWYKYFKGEDSKTTNAE
ncbi:hypothetical protein DFQ27_003276 [Actinomortierella ambigua]|uniref:Uncharacterized protein n=1 Tax=Actinomortierella ambigua TaxID=1343610 RepID=A0A9P6U5S5_9FUNG|nr:hypothetical protein DFQ27_003276 [Actinomortierella ambigua]